MIITIIIMISVDKNSEYIKLTTSNFSTHPSIINAIDRVSMIDIDIYCFDEYLDQDDYKFLTQHLKISNLTPGHKRHTTIVSNSRFPINKISHAISMTAIHNDSETVEFLKETETRKIYFILGELDGTIPKPYTNDHQSAPQKLYSHDLVACVYTRNTVDDEWDYDIEQSRLVNDNKHKIFRYNELKAVVEYNKSILCVLKPMLCRGRDHPRANPCVRRYQWVLDPGLIKLGLKVVNDDYSLRRKVEGEYSAKELFFLDKSNPIEGKKNKYYYQNKFGTPYGIMLLLIYNGKLECGETMVRSIDILQNSIELLKNEIKSYSASKILAQLKSDPSEKIQELKIPKKIELDLREYEDGKYRLFIDPSLLHMFTVKILQILDSVIGDDIELWKETSVYYKFPHQLVPEAFVMVKLPDNKIFHDKLVKVYPNITTNGTELVNDIIIISLNKCFRELQEIKSMIINDPFPFNDGFPVGDD
jgi:hypothetical protein